MRSQKWTKIGTPLPGYLVLKSVSGGPFFGHLLIWPDAGGARRAAHGAHGRTLAPGGPEERNRRFAQKSCISTVLDSKSADTKAETDIFVSLTQKCRDIKNLAIF